MKKTYVITGATGGIGLSTAEVLSKSSARLLLIGRNSAKLDRVVSRLRLESGNESIDGLVCDLSDMTQVRCLAAEVLQTVDRIDVLINNAGAFYTERGESVDGFERTFALNHLSYFLLTSLLTKRLIESAPARVVNVASDAHRTGVVHWDDLQFTRCWTRAGWTAYAQSKLLNILFTRSLARRLERTGVTANSLHPGFVNTGFARNNGLLGRVVMGLTRLFQIQPERAAKTVVWAATSEEAGAFNGCYFFESALKPPTAAAQSDADAERLWTLTEGLLEGLD